MYKELTVQNFTDSVVRFSLFMSALFEELKARKAELAQMKELWRRGDDNSPSNLVKDYADLCVGTHKSVPKTAEEIVFTTIRPLEERKAALAKITDQAAIVNIAFTTELHTDLRTIAFQKVANANSLAGRITLTDILPWDLIEKMYDIPTLSNLAFFGHSAVEHRSVKRLIELEAAKALTLIATNHTHQGLALTALHGLQELKAFDQIKEVYNSNTAYAVVKTEAASIMEHGQ